MHGYFIWLFQMKSGSIPEMSLNFCCVADLGRCWGSNYVEIIHSMEACQITGSRIRPFSRLDDLAHREIDMTDYEDLIATASNSPIPTGSSMYLRIKQRWWSTHATLEQ
jgi:hypothetical protein